MDRRAFAALIVCLIANGALAQGPSAPAPLPDKQQPQREQPIPFTLKADEGVVTALLTAVPAIKYCGFGGKERIAALSQAYGLRPDKLDPALTGRIVRSVQSEIDADKEAFCERAWRDYGENGKLFKGVLTQAAP